MSRLIWFGLHNNSFFLKLREFYLKASILLNSEKNINFPKRTPVTLSPFIRIHPVFELALWDNRANMLSSEEIKERLLCIFHEMAINPLFKEEVLLAFHGTSDKIHEEPGNSAGTETSADETGDSNQDTSDTFEPLTQDLIKSPFSVTREVNDNTVSEARAKRSYNNTTANSIVVPSLRDLMIDFTQDGEQADPARIKADLAQTQTETGQVQVVPAQVQAEPAPVQVAERIEE